MKATEMALNLDSAKQKILEFVQSRISLFALNSLVQRVDYTLWPKLQHQICQHLAPNELPKLGLQSRILKGHRDSYTILSLLAEYLMTTKDKDTYHLTIVHSNHLLENAFEKWLQPADCSGKLL